MFRFLLYHPDCKCSTTIPPSLSSSATLANPTMRPSLGAAASVTLLLGASSYFFADHQRRNLRVLVDSTRPPTSKPTPVPTPQHCIAGTHSELSSCISSSSAGDVIRLANDIAMTGQISISGKSAFTIKSSPGKRYTLRGSGSDRLFFISSSTVKFQDLRMENGKVNLSMKPPFFELFPPCSPLLSR